MRGEVELEFDPEFLDTIAYLDQSLTPPQSPPTPTPNPIPSQLLSQLSIPPNTAITAQLLHEFITDDSIPG